MDLKSFRKSRGLSQEECATELGLKSKGYICGIERKTATASLKVALKIENWSEGAVKAASLNPTAAELARSRAA